MECQKGQKGAGTPQMENASRFLPHHQNWSVIDGIILCKIQASIPSNQTFEILFLILGGYTGFEGEKGMTCPIPPPGWGAPTFLSNPRHGMDYLGMPSKEECYRAE